MNGAVCQPRKLEKRSVVEQLGALGALASELRQACIVFLKVARQVLAQQLRCPLYL